MSIVEPGSAGSKLFERVKDILVRPAPTWDQIDVEPASIGGLYRGYVVPLAAIPVVCGVIGMLVFGIGAFGVTIRPSPVWLIVQGLVQYVLSLGMVYVLALIIDGLAPNFGGTKDRLQAFKVAAYAMTASWVAGVFSLLPALALVGLLGALYSLYLLYLGLPKLMKTPTERAGTYFAVVLVVAIVIGIVISVVSASVMTLSGAMRMAGPGQISGTVDLPGQGSVNLGELEAASRRAEAAAKQLQSGNAAPATDPEVLKAYLPASVGGFTRGDVSAASGGAGGMQGSSAEADYAKGDARMQLEVTDLGAAAAIAGIAGAFDVKSSKDTATGYEKVGKVDGRMTQESYDRESKHGEYSVLVGDRFMVQASGDGVSVDDLKAAVGAVGIGRLESLAKAN
ncbi:Yip1 family protein [uncultured Phenylobacterium sp.]|uniref:Yip1 family protein n=1 Tax=uncultured Phenylobacterium sp. TaxID=349273 RepID=UPI0025DFC4D6|nr:Yip1 family protein [uncultured Phenylobacterium sp.]